MRSNNQANSSLLCTGCVKLWRLAQTKDCATRAVWWMLFSPSMLSLWKNNNVIGIEPEVNWVISLVIGGCAIVDRAGQTAINTQARTHLNLVRQRAGAERKTRLRPRYLTGYKLPADSDVIKRQKCEYANWEGHTVGPSNQDERSGFEDKTTWTEWGKMHWTRWISRRAFRRADEMMAVTQAQISWQSNL